MRTICSSMVVLVLAFLSGCPRVRGEQKRGLDSADLASAHAMLHQAYLDVKKGYYDPAFHGVNLDESYRRYDALLNSSESVNAAFRVIAGFLGELQDSHTFFMPPQRTRWATLDFTMSMIGDKCFVTRVRPGSDAQKKLHLGDQVLVVDALPIRRSYFENFLYLVGVLSPMRYETLVVQAPDGGLRTETVMNTVHEGKALIDPARDGSDIWDQIRAHEDAQHRDQGRTFEKGALLIWKIPGFFLDPESINLGFAKARKLKALILDLRGDSGGRSDVLKAMLSNVFDHPVIMATRVSRQGSHVEIINPVASPFMGKMIVLIDGGSASASEIFARVIQLNHRGWVIGDRSAGAAMEAHYVRESVGTDERIFYGLSVTSAKLVMTDGSSIEGNGVLPDELTRPTAADLAAGSDPVLSRAAGLVGVDLAPDAAGKLAPFQWTSP